MLLKIISLISLLLILIAPIYSKNKKLTKSYIGEFHEWNAISLYSSPDQIRIDPFNENIIWFTQPSIHGLSKFNFKNKKLIEYKIVLKKQLAKQYNKIIKYRPDGLVIDKNGILWFGEQSSGTLGKFDPKEKQIKHFKAPYKKANLTIPTVDHNGYIWITDHQNNKILRFDPKKKSFYIINVPSPNSWVVDLKTDSKNRIWYSSCLSNVIGMIDYNKKIIIEYSLPKIAPLSSLSKMSGNHKKSSWKGNGPAFIAIDSKDRIWFTLWATNKIAVFDPKTNILKYYTLLTNPSMASITITKNNVIFFSADKLNAIVMLDTKNDNYFHVFPIPTPKSGQKDGITVDSKGVVWFTEFAKNKFGRLKISDKKYYKPNKISHIQKPNNERITVVNGFVEKTKKIILKPVKIRTTMIKDPKNQ